MDARVTGQPVLQPCGWRPGNTQRQCCSRPTCWGSGLQLGQGSGWVKAQLLLEEAIPVQTLVPLRLHHREELLTSTFTPKRRAWKRNKGVLSFFPPGGHSVDKGFIIECLLPIFWSHWYTADMTVLGAFHFCVFACMCFKLLIIIYLSSWTLVYNYWRRVKWLYVCRWKCKCALNAPLWKVNLPGCKCELTLFFTIHFDVILTYTLTYTALCTVKSGDGRHCIVSRYMPCWNINVLMWNNICKIIPKTETWFVMFYDMIWVILIPADAMTTDTFLVIHLHGHDRLQESTHWSCFDMFYKTIKHVGNHVHLLLPIAHTIWLWSIINWFTSGRAAKMEATVGLIIYLLYSTSRICRLT